MTSSFLKLDHLGKNYGSIAAVEDVDLAIEQGEFMTFLGPSGSGKSTTLYMLAGFERPSRGDMLLKGKSIANVPSNKRNIGMVFQRYTLFPHLTVGENIAFPLKVRRRSQADIGDKVRDMLRLVRLHGFEDRKPGELSGGQQQRVALARALAYDPAILLMDEPLSALDKKLREEIQFEIKRIHTQTEVTILYVTHDQEEALRLSDRIAVFSHGVVDQVGTGFDLHENPATRFVAGFIGDSNFITCNVLEYRNGRATISIGQEIIIENLPAYRDEQAGKPAALMLRPERVSLSPRKRADHINLPIQITAATFLGSNIQVATEIDGQSVSVRLPVECDRNLLVPGASLYLTFSPDMARVFA
jgi:putative spermidine/putrescine transport system ATP-binding protein